MVVPGGLKVWLDLGGIPDHNITISLPVVCSLSPSLCLPPLRHNFMTPAHTLHPNTITQHYHHLLALLLPWMYTLLHILTSQIPMITTTCLRILSLLLWPIFPSHHLHVPAAHFHAIIHLLSSILHITKPLTMVVSLR